MKPIIEAYREVRDRAVKVHAEVNAQKVRKHTFTLFVQELESGKWSVSLGLYVKYQYKNNLTNYATAERSFKVLLKEFPTQEVAQTFAKVEKIVFETRTNNKVSIQAFELESFLF